MENWQFLYYLVTGMIFGALFMNYLLASYRGSVFMVAIKFLIGVFLFAFLNAFVIGPWLGF